MDVILTDKSAIQRVSQGLKDNSYAQQNSYLSPTNKHAIGISQLSSRNIASARGFRSAVQLIPLQALASNIETPKRALNSQGILSVNGVQNLNSDRIEEPVLKVVKPQPKITNNANLPSVFISERPQSIKIKKLITKQKLGDISVDQDFSPELAHRANPSYGDRGSKPFMSPQRVMSPNMSVQNLYAGSKISHNSQYDVPVRQVSTRESARKLQFENFPHLKTEENEANGSSTTAAAAGTKKQIVILKRFLSKSPESKIPVPGGDRQANFSNAMKFFDQFAVPIQKIKTKISLNEMITLKKIRTTQSNGILKRMLHVPSLNMYDIQEEPIKAQDNLKEWINNWQKSFNKKEIKYLQKILTCFWNSPEGCVSILKQASSKGSLQDVLEHHVSLPENCIQELTVSMLRGIHDIHSLIKQPHGAILASEVVFYSNYQPKLSPGLYHQQTSTKSGGSQNNIGMKESDKEESSNKLFNLNKISSIEEYSKTPSFSSDIFDFGYLLLTCALGNLDFYDSTGFYSLENLKSLIDLLPSSRRQVKNFCCILHSEEELRRSHCELSPTKKFRDSGPKSPLTNNFQLKSPKNQDSNSSSNKKASAPFTLLDLLRRNKRHSDTFIDFLCNCLRVDAHARSGASVLLDHEFLNETHASSGPLMSLTELISSNKREQPFEMSNNLNEEHLNRVGEAIKIVLVNREIKEKMIKFSDQNIYENKKGREYQKISALAMEIGVPIASVIEKFRNEIFKNELIH